MRKGFKAVGLAARAFRAAALALFLLALAGCSGRGGDIVSWCAADIGGEKIIAVTGGGYLSGAGLRYGEDLRVYGAEALPEIERGNIPKGGPLFQQDMADIKPLKVMAGDVTGDGEAEISVCVYKTAEFHPVMAKRPFFYRLEGGELLPVWLGSRLARPFDDYELADIDGDGTDEIISIESLENGGKILSAYRWKGFGFEELARSGELGFTPGFVSPLAIRGTGGGAEEYDIRLERAGDEWRLTYEEKQKG